MENKYCVVRSEKAGVFAGNLISINGTECTMENVRKLWYWEGACAIEELALRGVKMSNKCKFTVTIASMSIMGVIQVIPCTKEAEENIKSVPEWKY